MSGFIYGVLILHLPGCWHSAYLLITSMGKLGGTGLAFYFIFIFFCVKLNNGTPLCAPGL